MADREKIDLLSKGNYDTWKIQVEALLVKSDGWPYVFGSCLKPESGTDQTAPAKWELADRKARSDLILSISAFELGQIKYCKIARETLLKLEENYQSKGPARKATFLKQLTTSIMKQGTDIGQHLDKLFDAVDKLSHMDLEINNDLLAIILLHIQYIHTYTTPSYSLPASFENFRCAIETRDELSKPEVLKIKILGEADAVKNRAE